VKQRCSWRGYLRLAPALVLAGCAHAPLRPQPAAPAPIAVPSPAATAPVPDAIPRLEPRSAHGNPPFYTVAGRRYIVLPTSVGFIERGVASWYGADFHGLRTSTGEPYDMFAMTAAHKTLPLPCYARVTNLSNGRSVVVRINDRGPFVDNRVIDLSYSAASKLDMIRRGTAFVQLEVLTPGTPAITASLPVAAPAVATAMAGVSTVPAASVTPTPTPASAAPAEVPTTSAQGPAAAPSGNFFFIQVGAYSKAENADSVARKLRASGIEHVMTLAPTAAAPLQRVRVGPIESVQQFDALFARLVALGFPNARLAQD
jgi:rare lipoprotein A